MEVSKRERLHEFYRRLAEAPHATTSDEALSQLTSILNEVEDELTGIPNDPGNWRYDERIYPPQHDSMHGVQGQPRAVRFRSVGHNTYIGANGAIEIVSMDGTVELRKPGADGRGVWDQDPQ
ncbi:MAG TPA: hypothetical protein VLK84_29970 [Longimicrobium sp.]|nr:hypothetical protein [Longimicrobium sp.]